MALCSAHAVPPPDPKEAREAEILESIRTTFAAKGFDGASMQELARAAGMSVGNFYRYFPSKAAMVEAIMPVPSRRHCIAWPSSLKVPRRPMPMRSVSFDL